MHQHFSEWHRAAGIEPDGESLPKRWAGIEEFSPDHKDILALAQCFYGQGKPSDEFLAKFRQSFQDADPTFQMRGNDVELAVLAGAELVDTIERSSTVLGDFAALCLVTTSGQNLRKAPPVPEIPEIASRHLNSRSIKRAKIKDDERDLSSADDAFIESIKPQPAPFNGIGPAIKRIRRELAVTKEEANMLWWLFSEFSRDLNKPMREFSAPAISVIAGKELADLTEIIPGPFSIAAMVHRAIRNSHPETATKKMSLREALKGLPLPWRESFASTNYLAELEAVMPFSNGLKISLTNTKESACMAAIANATGLSDSRIEPNQIGYQIYLESLLRRAWKESK